MSLWKFYLDRRDWGYREQLMIVRDDPMGNGRGFVLPLQLFKVEDGLAEYDGQPSYEGRGDDVTGFLQAALEAAWDRGLRPTGFADFKNEIAAVRYHLEDMRKLAKVKE
jgi:hypothetical protein